MGACASTSAALESESHHPSSQTVSVSYSDKRSLQNILCSNDVQLIKPEYLIYLHNQGLRMPKCQDVPKKWILNVDGELDWDRLEIISLSYCWISKGHPDPDGYHLETLYHLCSAFVAGSLHTATGLYNIPGDNTVGYLAQDLMGQGWSTGSGDGRAVGVFIDWMSIPQDEPKGTRTDEETAVFKRALKNINIWYGHKDTTTWRLTCLPPGSKRPGYDESGWPTFERSIAGIISGSHKMLLIDDQAHTALKTADGDYLQLFLKYCDRDRQAPITPEVFNDMIQSKVFTNGADRDEIVIPRYFETFNAVIGHATALDVQSLGFGDQEAEDIMHLMRKYDRLKSLDVSTNKISMPLGDWAAFAIDLKLTRLAIGGNPLSGDIGSVEPLDNLIELRIDNTKIAGGIQAVQTLLNLNTLWLHNTKVYGDIQALQSLVKLTSLKLSGTRFVSGDIKAVESLVNLTQLWLHQTRISGDIQAVERLAKLTDLSLGDTTVSGDVKAVQNLVKMAALRLHKTQVFGDIQAVQSLVSVNELRLNHTMVSGDIQAVESLVNLKILSFHDTQVSGDIKAIESLVNLTELILDGTKVQGDIKAVDSLVKLTRLSLRGMQVSGDIKAVESLVKLTLLNLTGTQVSGDIKAVETLVELTTLGLVGTQVSGDSQAVRNRGNWAALQLND